MEKLQWMNQINGFALHSEILAPVSMLPRENRSVPIKTNLTDESQVGQKTTIAKN